MLTTNPTSKQELLETLTTVRASWEALLSQVGPDRMELRGVTGEWSVKDIVAHVAAWERRALAWLKAVKVGTWPEPPEWPVNLNEDRLNTWIFAANRGRQVQDVLNESRRGFDQLIEALELVPEQDLTAIGRFAWLGGKSLIGSIGGNTFEHYQVHAEAIRAWLMQRTTAIRHW